MQRYLWGIAGLLAAAALVVFVVLAVRPDPAPELRPLVSAAAPDATDQALLEGAVVLHAKDARTIAPPFALQEDVTAAGGLALMTPLSARSAKPRGHAVFDLAVPQAGTYRVWVRGRWRDECSNSVSLVVEDSRERNVGNDSVYNAWHWVDAGRYKLAAATHRVTLLQREAGAAVDQILFTRDETFRPAGAVLLGKMAAGVRRFADGFDRSPGHGLGEWDRVSGRWKIEFTFDPNRIPNQYSLVARPAGAEAVALVKGPPWKGCRLAFSARLPLQGEIGAVLDRSADASGDLRVRIRLGADGARLTLTGARAERSVQLGTRVQSGQWHRIAVERWAWVLRVFVDGQVVFDASDLEPGVGRVGLLAAGGTAVFDDVAVAEIPWAADDGKDFKIPWRVGEGAKWYRPTRSESDDALIGHAGAISTLENGLAVDEVIVEEVPEAAAACAVDVPGLVTTRTEGRSRSARGPHADGPAATVVRLAAGAGEVRIRRVAVRYGQPRPEVFRLGPYHFTEPRIEDPSDYLDFTPEEWRQIQNSPDADKLRRRKKYVYLVGGGGCVWVRDKPRWTIRNGELEGLGHGGELRYSQEIIGDLEMRAKVKLAGADTRAEIVLYSDGAQGVRVRIGAPDMTADASPNGVTLRLSPGAWHPVRIRVSGNRLAAAVGKADPRRARIARGDGGQVLLRTLEGRVYLDDIEFAIPREQPRGVFCAFDHRETGWWRRGGRWVDHGGMSCVLASHWISLAAPTSEGTLWHKKAFGPDAVVAFNIEEHSKWFGWTQNPSHMHYPYDNVRVLLASEEDPDRGYRLEVNSRDRTATVLYRNGKEVAAVTQDEDFPIRYVGGHGPYRPRKNRITFLKRGGLLRAVINGTEVLRYTDPQPISVRRIGLGGYRTHINFSHVEVREP